jgi:hypothetical protein
MARQRRYPFILLFVLLASACQEQAIQDQEERARVGIANQIAIIEGYKKDIDDLTAKIADAERTVVLCWDEPVVDISGDRVCKAVAGSTFLPDAASADKAQVLGAYVPPSGFSQTDGCTSATRIAMPRARYEDVLLSYRGGCTSVLKERQRQKTIAGDNGVAPKPPISDDSPHPAGN